MDKKSIDLTIHAELKMAQRNISLENIVEVLSNPELKETDHFDNELIHYIRKTEEKYLRVIVRREFKERFLVITAFYDRRFKRRK